MNEHIRIIMLHWGDPTITKQAVQSCMALRYPSFDLCLVNNDPIFKDWGPLLTEHQDRIQLIENPWNFGFSGGVNAGITALRGRTPFSFFMLLNNDIFCEDDSLNILYETMKKDPKIGIAGGITRSHKNKQRIYATYGKINYRQYIGCLEGSGEFWSEKLNSVREVDFVLGCAMLVKFELIERIGFFDPCFFLFHEEMDFCFRAKLAGFKTVYNPQAVFSHMGSHSLEEKDGFLIKDYFLGRNSILFLKKHGRGLNWIKFFLFLGLDFWYSLANRILPMRKKTFVLRYLGYFDGITGRKIRKKVKEFLGIPHDYL